MVKLVGILNVTPDSFSDGGKYFKVEDALAQAEHMFKDGASLVDVGAESTRPNAEVLTDEQEWERLEKVLSVLLDKFPGKISLDSYHPETIKRAFKIGPVIVNDVTGLNNPQMVKTIVELKPPKVVISHLPNMTLQEAHRLMPVTDINEVRNDLISKAQLLISGGVKKEDIILDPGIGFGKTMQLNSKLLTFAELVPDYDVMIGYSKKRFLGEMRMEEKPNIEAGLIAIKHGAKYLRVHDVASSFRAFADL